MAKVCFSGDGTGKNTIENDILRYLHELIKRNVISREALADRMLISYLCDSKIDMDYFSLPVRTVNY